jgi:hypothetical protein
MKNEEGGAPPGPGSVGSFKGRWKQIPPSQLQLYALRLVARTQPQSAGVGAVRE